MNPFNLLEEPWLKVMTDESGEVREVSLMELFENAHTYKGLKGETPSQDFAMLRFLLAIMATVFSRVDENRQPYEALELDKKFRVIRFDVEEEDEYHQELLETWENLWNKEAFPGVIMEYLNQWYDHFDLYHDEFPFYQIPSATMDSLGKNPGTISLKLINRLISESNNKVELFSPRSETYKNDLSNESLARWLIAYQGYTGTGDKAKHPEMEGSASKGWLLGLGGVVLVGESLKETLLLNMDMTAITADQSPVWEKDIDTTVNDLLKKQPRNIAELFTNWSRLCLLETNQDKAVALKAIQLPGINPHEFFLEYMTIWKYGKNGNDKDHFVPDTHRYNQSFWRNFGQLINTSAQKSSASNEEAKERMPGLIKWHNYLVDNRLISNRKMSIMSVGLCYNRDASTMPNNEVYDEIKIYDDVLADIADDGWVRRITDEINLTKETIIKCNGSFARDIKTIRNLSNDGFVDNVIKNAYYEIDVPFRNWLEGIHLNSSKEQSIREWRNTLKGILRDQAQTLLRSSGKRDFIGIHGENKYLNIEIAYNSFLYRLNSKLK